MTTDLTLIVTAHNETVVSGPTMRAADIAVEVARARGFGLRTMIALDAATPETSRYFHQPIFDHGERRVLHEGDPALSSSPPTSASGPHVAMLTILPGCEPPPVVSGGARAPRPSIGSSPR